MKRSFCFDCSGRSRIVTCRAVNTIAKNKFDGLSCSKNASFGNGIKQARPHMPHCKPATNGLSWDFPEKICASSQSPLCRSTDTSLSAFTCHVNSNPTILLMQNLSLPLSSQPSLPFVVGNLDRWPSGCNRSPSPSQRSGAGF